MILLALFGICYFSTTGEVRIYLQNRVIHPLEFKVRSTINRDPKLDPNIKLFFYDDKSTAKFKKQGPSIKQWGQVFEALNLRQPKTIIVDKLFDLPEREADIEKFSMSVRSKNTEAFAGIFLNATPIEGRDKFDLNQKLYDANLDTGESAIFSWIRRKRVTPYGATIDMQKAFTGFGHIVLSDSGIIEPIIQTNEDKFVPFLGLLAGDYRLTKDGVYSNDTLIKLDPLGRLPVNFVKQDDIERKAYSMRDLILAAASNRPISVVNKDDIVIIIPAMYTGHTDWVDSPLGLIPGGYLLISVANSTIAKNWLNTIPWYPFAIIFIFAAVYWIHTIISSDLHFSVIIFATISTTVIGGLFTFCFLNTFVPWFEVSLVLLIPSIQAVFVRLFQARVQEIVFEHESKQIEKIQRSLLPESSENEYFEIASLYSPADKVGGDWYYYFFDEQHLRAYFFIADITGHGLGSSLSTGVLYGSVSTTFESIRSHPLSMKDELYLIAEAANKSIYQSSRRADQILTMAIICLDFKRQELGYLNAGHLGVFYKTPGKIRSILRQGTPIGVDQKPLFGYVSYPLEGNERFFLYTDGLLENAGPDGRTLSRRIILKIFSKHDHPQEILNEVMKMGRSIWKGKPAYDDVTILSIGVKTHPQVDSKVI